MAATEQIAPGVHRVVGGLVNWYLVEEERELALVDALATLDVLSRATGPRLLPDALNADPDRTRASLHAVAEADAGTILPGHGEPFRGLPADAVARARALDAD